MKSSSSRIFVGCIPRILRRILCFNTLSNYPFDNNDHLKEDCNEKSDVSNTVGSSGTTSPGVVAKLMGLESLPLLERRRRMIIPITYEEAEDENFLIFSFESQLKKKKSGKKKSGIKNNKENINKAVSKGDLLGDLQVVENGKSNVLRPLNNNNNYCQRNVRLKRSKVNSDTEVDSENSSPNSVLEFVEFSGHHHQQQQASCSGDVARKGNSRMRRTLCEELEKCEDSDKEKKRLLMINNVIGFGDQNVYVENWNEIGMEVTKLRWVQDEMFRNGNYVKEIGVDIASLILSQLLDELVVVANLNHF